MGTMTLCLCGCGGKPSPSKKFIRGHHQKGENNNNWKGGRKQIECACGCGQLVMTPDLWYRHVRYRRGHSTFKGGRVKSRGYWYIWKPDHRFANSIGYIAEHRLVYEESRDCCLLSWADIHHIDENGSNNVWYNLRPLTRGQHNLVRQILFNKPLKVTLKKIL